MENRMYAVVIKFPHENWLEGPDEVLVRVLCTAIGIEDAYRKLEEVRDRFGRGVEITPQSKEYYLDVIALPETEEEFEDAIKYSIEKASFRL